MSYGADVAVCSEINTKKKKKKETEMLCEQNVEFLNVVHRVTNRLQ